MWEGVMRRVLGFEGLERQASLWEKGLMDPNLYRISDWHEWRIDHCLFLEARAVDACLIGCHTVDCMHE